MTLADRIVVINNGIIEQIGTPIELYSDPQNKFVAEFIGSPKMNILEVENNNKLIIKNEEIKPNTSKIGIRPEHILISNEDNFKLSGKIRHLENLGEHLLTYISLENNEEIIAKVDNVGDRKIGDKINLFWDSSKIHYFNKENKRI